jgi:hypothetical protein
MENKPMTSNLAIDQLPPKLREAYAVRRKLAAIGFALTPAGVKAARGASHQGTIDGMVNDLQCLPMQDVVLLSVLANEMLRDHRRARNLRSAGPNIAKQEAASA